MGVKLIKIGSNEAGLLTGDESDPISKIIFATADDAQAAKEAMGLGDDYLPMEAKDGPGFEVWTVS